jgi:hypothetical protein
MKDRSIDSPSIFAACGSQTICGNQRYARLRRSAVNPVCVAAPRVYVFQQRRAT